MDIQRAIAAKLTIFTFEGTEMSLRWSAWCAITVRGLSPYVLKSHMYVPVVRTACMLHGLRRASSSQLATMRMLAGGSCTFVSIFSHNCLGLLSKR